MATERRPLRPATRVSAPAAAPVRTATSRVPAAPPPPARPAVKTATARVASVSPAAAKKTTGRVGRPGGGTARGGAAPAPKNNTMLFVGIGAGALVLVVGLAVAFSGGDDHKKHAEPAAKKAPAGKPDVSQLERDGMAKCNEGVKLIKGGLGSNDKAALERGVALISEGNGLLDKANTIGNTGGYDTKDINQTLYLARKKLQELRN